MNNKYIKTILTAFILLFAMTSCLNDLDLELQDDDVVDAEVFYDDPASYQQVIAKLYAGLAVSGQQGPAGQSDISGIDEGFGQYLRGYWQVQELCTDEAVIAWGDGSLPDFHEMDWNKDNEFIRAIYDRIFYQITACNEFIRQTTDAKLDGRGVTGTLRTDVEFYRAEARFLRALSYFHALDLFGNVPFVTEADEVGFFTPDQTNRTDLFNYIESELTAIENLMVDAKQNQYARADKAAVWMLQARLYINANVYTGSDKFTECISAVNKVINAGYTLESQYQNLFLADNDAANGIIFPIAFDGQFTQTYGGTTYLVHAAVGGSMDPADYGINGGWGGLRTTSAFVDKFPSPDPTVLNAGLGADSTWGIVGDATPGGWVGPDVMLKQDGADLSIYVELTDGFLKFRENNQWINNFGDSEPDGILDTNSNNNIAITAGVYKITMNLTSLVYSITEVSADSRGSFYTDGQEKEIESITTFTDGYAVNKFKNIDRNGNAGSDTSGNFPDTDFPLFRLADAYLMYAEAVVRGGSGGNMGDAVNYANQLQERATGGTASNISAAELTLDYLLDERARELHWEAYRRTDLIRFGKFTGSSYVWPWKGGVKEGVSVSDHLNLYPIPASDLNANPNLVQNAGY
jgi:hypothetical protein